MKRVLLVTGGLDRGGLETVAMQIVRYADRKSYKFDFLVYGSKKYAYEDEAIRLGCRVIRLNYRENRYASYYKEIKNTLKEYGPYDIVHAHIYFNSSIVMRAAKTVGVPLCIAHSHSKKRLEDNGVVKNIAYLIMRKMFKRYADRICACSYEAGTFVFGEEEFKKRGSVLLNPVDIDAFAFSENARVRIRKELNINSNQIVIGQVSRLVKGKNQKFLLELLSSLRERMDVVLLIVGNGIMYEELQRYANKLKIGKIVRFTGERTDVAELLSTMDIFVMTSKYEGLGIVLIEALANGLRCLCEEDAIIEKVRALEGCSTVSGFHKRDWENKIENITKCGRCLNAQKIYEELKDFSSESFSEKIKLLYS